VIKLEKLISELFELSLLEAKQVRIHKEPVMISELVNDIGGSYQIEAKKRNIELVLQLAKKLPAAFADIALIERVLQNLMDNALKFTPENGKIIISTAYQNGQVLITVRDSGKGISKEKLDQIFTGFYKENNFNDVKYSTGLGLIIVKKILELHGSNLEIESSEDKGSMFSFSLPIYIKE
jgi:signal transduction histidine kinase